MLRVRGVAGLGRRWLGGRSSEIVQRARDRPLADHLAYDAAHVWQRPAHPYTSAARSSALWSVARAEGVHLEFESGERVIDGMASWWAAVHGYNHPVINAAAKAQLDSFSHVMFGGLTHRSAVTLCELLVDLSPAKLNRVFLSDSGSVAVEVAIKMALQYWVARGRPKKTKLVACRGAYHGDTFGAMSVCDPVSSMHAELFPEQVARNIFVPRPDVRFGLRPGMPADDAAPSSGPTAADELERVVREHADTIAAVILEPVCQGAGGMWLYDPAYVKRARQVCDDYGVLLIADEIATGFGRTGTHLFACSHMGVSPDILCVGKAMTGGYVSMAATLATDEVALAHDAAAPPLMHGPTFMGNALASAIAVSSLELLTSDEYDWRGKVSNIEKQLAEGLAPCASMPGVADVRVLGAIGVVQLKSTGHDHARMAQEFVKRGVWLRTFRNNVYCMPPFVISPEELAKLTRVMCEVIADLPQDV
ncbi:adenosylmethionine-8-amino-7-oxononanoate aminotransferase [Pelagophyceae sp. CCMP2097]|nr:adenosylmethionine-8-amino-7-oxononanoate aminotransferase [Pelagophyceae sp. CCMP2097]